jgi:hypothetical protein
VASRADYTVPVDGTSARPSTGVTPRTDAFVVGLIVLGVALALVLLLLLVVLPQERQQDAALQRQDAALRQVVEANRIQDAHNIQTPRALMRAALGEQLAGRSEQARLLAMSAMAAMIGLYHQPCGGVQTITVPGSQVPPALRGLFSEGNAYTILGSAGQGQDEVLEVRVNAATTC